MKVMQILKQKGSTAVETCTASTTVADATRTLASRKIGALVVLKPDGGIAGIVSERDIVRHLASDGPSCLTLSVRDVMTARVECCAPEDEADRVLERMTVGRFRHMPVLVRGQLGGLLSIGDVVKARMGEIEAENEAMAHMLSG